MIINELEIKDKALIDIAEKIIVAARTAPKGRGLNNIELIIATGDSIKLISDKMLDICENKHIEFFKRDANNILNSSAIVIIGAKIKTAGLPYCGLCGFENCNAKNNFHDTPCVFNTIDLGIALGSAVSSASLFKVDNRIMYTIGMAVKELKLMNDDIKIIMGIPISATSKSPFFDR